MVRKKTSLFPIIKVVSTCNLNCDYCSAEAYMEHNRDSIMAADTLRRTIEELARVREDGTYLWHGGEPILAGKDFFELVTTIQQNIGLDNPRNAIQSNGILVTSDWAKFFEGSHFDIGISIDGPEAIHNESRIFSNGAGSHRQVMRGISALQEKGKSFGVLVVVTNQSKGYSRDIFQFLLESGIKKIDFKPCYGDSRHDVSLTDFAKFMIDIFDIWVEIDDPDIKIRTLEGFMHNLFGGQASLCSQSGNCVDIITIDYDGGVYPCDRFMGDRYRFGNIMDTPLDTLYDESARAIKFRDYVEKQRQSCQTCSYQPVCKSGCTQERDYWPEEYCDYRAMIIDHIRDWLVSQGEEPIELKFSGTKS